MQYFASELDSESQKLYGFQSRCNCGDKQHFVQGFVTILIHLTNQLLFFIWLLILIYHLDIGLQQAFCKYFNAYNDG